MPFDNLPVEVSNRRIRPGDRARNGGENPMNRIALDRHGCSRGDLDSAPDVGAKCKRTYGERRGPKMHDRNRRARQGVAQG